MLAHEPFDLTSIEDMAVALISPLENATRFLDPVLCQASRQRNDEEGWVDRARHAREASRDLGDDIVDAAPLLALAADCNCGSYAQLCVFEKQTVSEEVEAAVRRIGRDVPFVVRT